MNIQEAKETIEKALRAYFARDEIGFPLVPLRQQRPILLIGPPGIGKTAIMEQIPKHITAEYILQYVRAMKNSIGSNVETLYKLMEDRVEALEFIVNQNCRMIGIRLQDMKTRPNLLVAAINRQGKVIIPGGQDSFEAGDSVIIVTTETGLQDIHEILAE